MRGKLIPLAVVCFGLLAPIASEATPIFINGGFEAGGGPFTWATPANGTNTPGWALSAAGEFPIITSNIACGGSYGAGNPGCNYMVLGGGETGGFGSIEQTLGGFTVGASYNLTWSQASEYVASDTVHAQIIGASTLAQDFVTSPAGTGALWNNWQTETFTFVADSTSLTFSFNGVGTSYNDCISGVHGCDPGVDQFQITEVSNGPSGVPEPASLALLGSGLLGVALRRRRNP